MTDQLAIQFLNSNSFIFIVIHFRFEQNVKSFHHFHVSDVRMSLQRISVSASLRSVGLAVLADVGARVVVAAAARSATRLLLSIDLRRNRRKARRGIGSVGPRR